MHVDDPVETAEMRPKAVPELEEEGGVSVLARLADRFEHAVPSVGENVERLRRLGSVDPDEDRPPSPADAGRRTATAVMRTHRLAEMFLDRPLDQPLGPPWTISYGDPVQDPDGGVRSVAGEVLGNSVRITAGTAVGTAAPVTVRIGDGDGDAEVPHAVAAHPFGAPGA